MKGNAPFPWSQHDWPCLLEAARGGVDGAASEVFERLSSYCSMVAANRLAGDLLPKVSGSDIAQKSLLEAFVRFPTFEGSSEAEIRSWLKSIIEHNAIDAARHYRDAQRRTVRQEQPLDSDRAATTIAAPAAPPSLALRKAEQDLELQRALAQLNDSQRRIIELRYREGLDFREAAAAMDISDVAARKLCSRAIEALRRLLARDDGTQPRTRC
jgi:RNA polymerase sigma-70 factor (ECF subfamily)